MRSGAEVTRRLYHLFTRLPHRVRPGSHHPPRVAGKGPASGALVETGSGRPPPPAEKARPVQLRTICETRW